MNKFAMLIDSTVYIPQKMIEENNISVVSLNVDDGSNSYKEVDVTVPFIFKRQDEGAHWKTSAPGPGEFLEAYENLLKQGYEKIFCVLLSKNISGTYQSALLGKNMLDNPSSVHLFDTSLCAYGTEMIMIELVEMVNNQSSEEEIVNRITSIIETSGQMFTVENLFSLVKGGRLSVAKAAIGTVLRIKPVIKVIDGKLQLAKSERTHKKLNNYLVDSIKESLNGKQKVTFYVTSQDSIDNAKAVEEILLTEFPGSKLTFTEYLGPVFSIHVGKKGYGISWFSE
jgi:DegV family protein with EDD domain